LLRTASVGRGFPSFLVMALDMVGLALVAWFAVAHLTGISVSLPVALAFMVLGGVSLYIFDAYGIEQASKEWHTVARAVGGVAVATLLASGILAIWPTLAGLNVGDIWPRLLSGAVLFAIYASVIRLVLGRRVRNRELGRRWLLLGYDNSTKRFLRQFHQFNTQGDLVVYTDDKEFSGDVDTALVDARIVAGEQGLDELLDDGWTAIVISDEYPASVAFQEKLMQLRLGGTRVLSMVAFFEAHWLKLPVGSLHNKWFFESEGFVLAHDKSAQVIKRITDIVVSLVLLVFMVPFLPLVAVAIKLDSPGPVFYRQRRSGQGGMPIDIIKFRTMVDDAEKDGARWAQENDPRITRVGKFLRATRIDETPQLYNVLVGEMSLIGPRPERPSFIETLREEIPFYDIRGVVKPGLTGWAQVLAPYGSSVEDSENKLAYDLFYIKNFSILLDVIVLLKTVRVVLFGQGR